MRNIFSRIMLVAAAAMAFVSCQKQEIDAQETFSATLTVNADVQTKTYLEDNAILWGTGEAVKLYLNDGEANFISSASADQFDGQASAAFTFELNNIKAAESYVIGGIYPVSAVVSDNNDASKYKVILPAIQNAEAGKYDPSAFIMVLKPETLYELPESHTASFRRAVALNKITLTGVKEDITSVEITVPEEKYLAGRRYFDLTAGTSGDIYRDKKNTLTVNSSYTGSSIDVWFTSWGVELAEGENLTVKMTSATGTYTRSIAARTGGIKFLEGDLNTLTINMTTSDYVANDDTDYSDYSGDWLITGTKTDGTMVAAGAYVSGNNINAIVGVTLKGGTFEYVDGIENCKMNIEKVTDGTYAGKYTIKDANGLYLYAAGANSDNHLKAASLDVNNSVFYWSISIVDGQPSSLVATGCDRNDLRFNKSLNYFSCYAANTSASKVTLYPYSMVAVGTTPEIVISSEEPIVVDAEAGEVTINYTIKNPVDDSAVQASADVAWLTDVQYTDGTVTYTVEENTGAERKATVTLSYEGATPVEVVVTQDAKPAADAMYYVKVVENSSDLSGTYLLVCEDTSEVFAGIDGNYGANKPITISNGRIESNVTNDAYQIVLTKSEGGYYLITFGGKYLTLKNSDSTYISLNDSFTDNSKWNVYIDSTEAAITNAVSTDRHMYRSETSSGCFAVYASKRADYKYVQLYKLSSDPIIAASTDAIPQP